MSILILCLLELVVAFAAAASSGSFLGSRSHTDDFRAAMDSAMSCSLEATTTELHIVERILEPMWRTAHKNRQGLVEWLVVRQLAQRYFMQQWSLLLRGFEPVRQVNNSHSGMAEILKDKAPSAVQALLETSRSSNGFSLKDIISLVATLEHLILEADSMQLELAYVRHSKSTHNVLAHSEFMDVVQSYMVAWLVGDDQETLNEVWSSDSMWQREQREKIIPKYREIESFVSGLVTAIRYEAQHNPKVGDARLSLLGEYTYADALYVARTITRKFSSFWESECQIIKASLSAMDTSGSGRVTLKDFYGANADGEWRFGESKAYLKELGILDESSQRLGAQVIISNYVQAASNCIAQPHYFLCCSNECETVLNDVEGAVGAPYAQPEQILAIVGNMTDFEDDPAKISAALRFDLVRIAERHAGEVPLHGRLFAQWLHFVFPRECPFPQKAGDHSAQSPVQFGDHFIASAEEISSHATMRSENESVANDINALRQMTHWSAEEDAELIKDNSLRFHAPWESNDFSPCRFISMIALLLAVSSALVGNKRKCATPGFVSVGNVFV